MTGGVEVRLEAIDKGYLLDDGSRMEIVSDFDLQIEAGSFCAILGPSGCGKSTLLRLFAGLEPPDAGSVVVGSKEDGSVGRVGLMLQQYPSLPWLTVRKNVELALRQASNATGTRNTADRVMYFLSRVGLAGWENAYPRELSGGMLQRLALARTLALNPDVVLLDEPLGALDALTRYDLQKLIRELHQSEPRTYVMVTHDVSEALAVANRVVVMGHPGQGLLYDSATTVETLDREGLIRLLRGTHLTFAAGDSFEAHALPPASRHSDGYNMWLGLTEKERIEALASDRVTGAFFSVAQVHEVLPKLNKIDPVVVCAVAARSDQALGTLVLESQTAPDSGVVWAVPKNGLDAAIVSAIDESATLDGRVRRFDTRHDCTIAVAGGQSDACISDGIVVRNALTFRERRAVRSRPLPDDIQHGLWSVLVVPRHLAGQSPVLSHAIRRLRDDVRECREAASFVCYLDDTDSTRGAREQLEMTVRVWKSEPAIVALSSPNTVPAESHPEKGRKNTHGQPEPERPNLRPIPTGNLRPDTVGEL